MKIMFLKYAPSKFTGGISSLWRGMELTYIQRFIFDFFKLKVKNNYDFLLYESARSAILHSLKCLNITNKDQVIISSFTCDAVTKAVINSGAKIVYVDINADLTMNDKCVMQAINKNTKVLILQNTFGRLGLKIKTINEIKKKNIFIIGDNCLSAGSKFKDYSLEQFGDVSIFSLEASKTVTIGWGGVLKINNTKYKKKIISNYNTLKSINIFSDIRRLFQLSISSYLLKYPKSFGSILWYFFYGMRIFRKSNNNAQLNPKKIGPLTKQFFLYLFPKFKKFYKKTNKNYIFFTNHVKKAKLKCPLIQRKNEFIVTPRIPLFVKNKDKILQLAKNMKIEIGDWFTECPPKLNLDRSNVHSYKNSQLISKKVINIPSYFSLEKKEILELKKLILHIGLIERD
jgi:dTDP-4-amino-4,6-dideoxygalactose transaminase